MILYSQTFTPSGKFDTSEEVTPASEYLTEYCKDCKFTRGEHIPHGKVENCISEDHYEVKFDFVQYEN